MNVDQQRVEEAASSIAEQLCLLYPTGPPAADDQIQNRLSQLAMDGNSATLSFDSQELLQVARVAAEKWKSTENTTDPVKKTGPKSFSLFDQLQGGFDPPVTVEEILEASTRQEKLAVFKRISYVEDLVMDWSQIQPILRDALQVIDDTTMAFLELHRKWFDQCRSSTEYLGLQYELCENLMVAIVYHLASPEVDSANHLVVILTQNWHDMFLDIMQCGHYSEEGARDIELYMMLIFRNLSITPSTSNRTMPSEVLALIDPQARWFRSWTDHVSPQHLVSLLETSNLLPDLVMRSRSQMTDDPSEVPQQAIQFHSVSILGAVINATRVAFFPWHLLALSPSPPLSIEELQQSTQAVSSSTAGDRAPTNPQLPGHDEMESFLDVFVAVAFQSSNTQYTLQCCDAIETILWGLKTADMDVDRYLSIVKSRVASCDTEKHTAVQLLNRALGTLE